MYERNTGNTDPGIIRDMSCLAIQRSVEPIHNASEDIRGITVVTQEGNRTFLSENLVQKIPLLRDMTINLGQLEECVPLHTIKCITLQDIITVLQSDCFEKGSSSQRLVMDTILSFDHQRIAEAANAANFLQMDKMMDIFLLCLLDIIDQLPMQILESHPVLKRNGK